MYQYIHISINIYIYTYIYLYIYIDKSINIFLRHILVFPRRFALQLLPARQITTSSTYKYSFLFFSFFFSFLFFSFFPFYLDHQCLDTGHHELSIQICVFIYSLFIVFNLMLYFAMRCTTSISKYNTHFSPYFLIFFSQVTYICEYTSVSKAYL